jgi:hypothetical protein
MNDKWADYVITAVVYNSQHTHIVAAEAREDLGSTIGGATQMTRQKVVDLIKSGKRFVTATKSNDKWTKGEDVRIIKIGSSEYIRTDNNSVEKDNLGKLPELSPT